MVNVSYCSIGSEDQCSLRCAEEKKPETGVNANPGEGIAEMAAAAFVLVLII